MFIEIITALFLAWVIWSMVTYAGKRNMPPGPFPLPLIGNTLQMLSNPQNPFEELARKYGDIFTFYRPSGPVVVLNNASLIHEARVGTKDDLSGRNPEDLYPFDQIFGSNSVSMADYSPAYIFRRKVFKSAMHVFGSGIDESVERARRVVDIAIEQIDSDPETPFCPRTLLVSATLSQLWLWLSSKEEPPLGPVVTSLREYLDIANDLASQSPLFQLFPFLRFFPTKFRRNIKRACEIPQATLYPEFRSHQKTYTPGVVRDLTDSFICAYEKEFSKETGKDIGSLEDIPTLMMDAVFGASDTTSNSLTWLILYLALHQDVQRKIHAEIDTIIGKDRLPDMRDVPNMPYLQSTLCEVQRISGVIPFSASNAIRDITIRGYKIPKGTFVMINMKQAHHDEREWPEPNGFKPERFLDSDGNFVGWSKLHAFMPFGLGRRDCPGSQLAKIMMFIFASTLLHRYKIEIPEGAEKPSTESPFIASVVRPKDFKVIAKKR
jgi:cytochrome P450